VSSGAQFVIAAYAVIWFGLVMYVVVIGARTARLARELELLGRIVESDRPSDGTESSQGT
jgi:CcmD family protein